MNDNMTDYSLDVERRLDRAYNQMQGNAFKKYGYEKLGAKHTSNLDMMGGHDGLYNKMSKQASSYLAQ